MLMYSATLAFRLETLNPRRFTIEQLAVDIISPIVPIIVGECESVRLDANPVAWQDEIQSSARNALPYLYTESRLYEFIQLVHTLRVANRRSEDVVAFKSEAEAFWILPR